MKIGLVSPYDYSYPGGVTIHISQLARQFQAKGHLVRIMAPCSKPLTDDLRDCVIPVGQHPVPVPSGGSIARITLSVFLGGTVQRLLQRENFDVVHLHEPFTPMLPVTFLRLSDFLNVATFHAFHSKPRGYGLAKFILRKWLKRVQGRIAVSEPARKFVARHFPGDYRIIPNGIDLELFSPLVPPMDCLGDGKLNIVFVGRLEKRKGLGCLLKAFVLLKRDFPEARLVVVGPGKRLLNKYRQVIQRQNIKDVVFTGYVPYAELPCYYRSAHVFCAPALGEESFGIVLLESMACGRAVVASDIEGYASLVTHGEEGLLVPPKNPQALRDALGQLLADRPLREEMGYRGSLKAGEFSWEKVGARVLDYYDEVATNYPWIATNAGQLVSSLRSSGSG